jgi:hypothetical protein
LEKHVRKRRNEFKQKVIDMKCAHAKKWSSICCNEHVFIIDMLQFVVVFKNKKKLEYNLFPYLCYWIKVGM